MAARSLLFQLPRFVSSRLGVLYHHTSHEQVVAHRKGDAIIREADMAAELLAGKRRAPPPKIRPDKPVESPGKDKHNGVPDKKSEEGKQVVSTQGSGEKVDAALAVAASLAVRRPKPPGPPREGPGGRGGIIHAAVAAAADS